MEKFREKIVRFYREAMRSGTITEEERRELSPAEFYEEVATEMNVPIEVDAISDILQYPTNKSDAIHTNANGYRMMAEQIHQLLQERGAI